MPQCQFSVFCCFRVLEKYTANILGIGRNKSQSSYFSRYETESNVEMEGSQGQPHHRVVRPSPWPRHQVVGPPGPHPEAALPPIYSPRRENPMDLINFPENILQAAAIVEARSGGSKSSSRNPAREGNHHRRPSSSPCQPPE
jgi:hypothetical protein